MPIGGHRFEGLLTPVVPSPVFCIRKRATRLFALDSYISNDILNETQARIIRNAVANRLNIVVAGGTGSGKTTLTNAIIGEIVDISPEHRLVILEDTAEIQYSADNAVYLHTSDTIDMGRLLKSTMRLRPDRIIVGEVRDGAALTLLKAWNTGHPGGIATIHANSAYAALTRLEQLVAEVSTTPMPEVIGEAVDMVIFIERTPTGRRVSQICAFVLEEPGVDRLREARVVQLDREVGPILSRAFRPGGADLGAADEDPVARHLLAGALLWDDADALGLDAEGDDLAGEFVAVLLEGADGSHFSSP